MPNRIDGLDDGCNAAGHAGGVATRAYFDCRIWHGLCQKGTLISGKAFATNSGIMDVTIDPMICHSMGDLGPWRWNQSLDENTLCQRIDIGKILPSKVSSQLPLAGRLPRPVR